MVIEDVVPIKTRPLESIRIRSVLFDQNANGVAVIVPNCVSVLITVSDVVLVPLTFMSSKEPVVLFMPKDV